MNQQKIGLLLANLGSPTEPTAPAIRRYLWQFLRDPRVVDLPKWLWYPLLKCLILPRRAKHIAKNYQRIWTNQGSPLIAISQQQRDALQAYFNAQQQDICVEIGMSYAQPSINEALERLLEQGIQRLVLFPLYPQYSSTTTGASIDALAHALTKHRNIPPFEIIHSYHNHKSYISALVQAIQPKLASDELLLFSYHGIPLRYQQQGDYYQQHCLETSNLVASELGLKAEQWAISFQSRFGREKWLEPATEDYLVQASQHGINKIAVVCPGFAADCLETLEEIEQQNRALFLDNGGQSYQYIPALNAEKVHIDMMAQIVCEKLK